MHWRKPLLPKPATPDGYTAVHGAAEAQTEAPNHLAGLALAFGTAQALRCFDRCTEIPFEEGPAKIFLIQLG
jgi:hypothetical protein